MAQSIGFCFYFFLKKEKDCHFGSEACISFDSRKCQKFAKIEKKSKKKSWIATTLSLYLCALCVHIKHINIKFLNIKFLKYKKNPIDRSIQRIFWIETNV